MVCWNHGGFYVAVVSLDSQCYQMAPNGCENIERRLSNFIADDERCVQEKKNLTLSDT